MSVEDQSVVDRLIRQAIEDFEHLPGFGKPIPGAGQRDDSLWWVRSWVERNRVDATSEDRSESRGDQDLGAKPSNISSSS